MSRRAKKNSKLFSFALVLLAIPFWWRHAFFPLPVVKAATVSAVADDVAIPTDFKVMLIRSGLGADALAASGISSGSVAAILQAVAAEIGEAPSALSAADASYATYRTQADHLQAAIQSGTNGDGDVSAYQTASSNLATATAARQVVIDGYFNAATALMTNDQKTALTNIRANRSWELPLEFLVVNRSQSEWVQVRDALANERIAVELPDTLNEAAQSALATWRADTVVASAKTSLDSHLAAVTSAWNSVSGE